MLAHTRAHCFVSIPSLSNVAAERRGRAHTYTASRVEIRLHVTKGKGRRCGHNEYDFSTLNTRTWLARQLAVSTPLHSSRAKWSCVAFSHSCFFLLLFSFCHSVCAVCDRRRDVTSWHSFLLSRTWNSDNLLVIHFFYSIRLNHLYDSTIYMNIRSKWRKIIKKL